jgi:hypothetical protein
MKRFSLSALLLVLAVGCTPEEQITQEEYRTLLAPEPNSVRLDYVADTVQFRLFGTQPSDGTATIAEIPGWKTRTLREDDLLARNLRVAHVGDQWVHFETPGGFQRLAAGEQMAQRRIRHRFDRAAEYQGKHQWRVHTEDLVDLASAHGPGIQLTWNDQLELWQVQTVAPQGTWSALGFQAGDFLLNLNGEPMTPQRLETLPALLQEQDAVEITWSRAGVPRTSRLEAI